MAVRLAEKCAAFRRLHEAGCFVMGNPFDAGSAVMLERLGFKALASASSAMSWTMGKPDHDVERDVILKHLETLTAATDLPVNADYENGFADDPDGLAANVARALATGIAGLTIEDSPGDKTAPLYEFDLAVRRIKAARAAIDRSGSGAVLTARCEGLFPGRPGLAETVKRIKAYAAAGVDCLYAPGMNADADITAIVAAAGGKAVTMLTMGQPVAALASLGIRRITVGGLLAGAAYGEVMRVAKDILERGRFDGLDRGLSFAEMNKLFATKG